MPLTWRSGSRLTPVTPAALEERLHAAAEREAPAVVFGAVWRDGTTFVRCAGKADLRTGRPVTEGTPFAWFSLTKLFTATALMQLAESGRVALDAPVSRYLPGHRLIKRGREATVRQLLSHSAGLRNPIPVRWSHLAEEQGPGLEALIERVIGPRPKLAFAPGDRFSYSNLGYLLLGRLIERVSGLRYEEYLQRRVLEPLGCTGTGFSIPGNEATGYQRRWTPMGLSARWMVGARFFDEPIDGYRPLRLFTLDGAPYGGLIGPVCDLLRFARMALGSGMGERARVLEEGSVREMLTPARDRRGRALPIGLGWHLGKENSAFHLGGGCGYRSELRLYPARGYAAVVLANETGFPTGKLTRLLASVTAAERR